MKAESIQGSKKMRQLVFATACGLALAVSGSTAKSEENGSEYSPNVYLSGAGGAAFFSAESLIYPPPPLVLLKILILTLVLLFKVPSVLVYL
ncbi:MAG: hypothetical protein GY948_14225 [Alphaproteobacteria bacterium]|nr:hypothetical protein [Alphaproteobacteria bacterium]